MARRETIRAYMLKKDKTGFVFGAISLFFVGFAFLFVLFVNIGAGQDTTRSYVDMLLTGFFGAFAFSIILNTYKKKKKAKKEMEQEQIFEPMSTLSVTRQFSTVFPIGIMAGVFVVAINLAVNVTGNILLGSAFGPIDPTNFGLGFLAGVAEELFFRGFLQTMFELFLGGTNLASFIAPIPTALIFAWFHFFAYQGNILAWWVMFAIGLGLGYIRALSQDIGTPILAHVITNTFAMMGVVVAFIQSMIFVFVIIIAVVVVLVLLLLLGTRRR